jgi:serine/threonine protein kinase
MQFKASERLNSCDSLNLPWIAAHEHLHNAGILHGDISENNVLIELGTDKESGSTRRGLLIDLDMARFVTRDQHFPDGSYLKGTQHATHPKITVSNLLLRPLDIILT